MNTLHSVVRFRTALESRFRNFWFRCLGVRLNGYVWMQRISIPRQWSDVTLEKRTALDDGVVLLCSGTPRANKLVIRTGTYINRYTIIDASEKVEIAEYCMIGPHCYITDHDHAHEPGKLVAAQPLLGKPVSIGRDVWIGAGV